MRDARAVVKIIANIEVIASREPSELDSGTYCKVNRMIFVSQSLPHSRCDL